MTRRRKRRLIAAAAVLKLTVTWPSGAVQVLGELAAGKVYTITEDAGATARKGAPQRAGKPMFAASDLLAHAKVQEREFDDFSRQFLSVGNSLSQHPLKFLFSHTQF